jgi:nucleoside-diphosphate-sugar epimerase
MNQIIQEDLKFITEANLPWHKLEGENILITGAGGFLPAYLVKTILHLNETRFHKKAKVFALVRKKNKALHRFSNYKNRRDLQFIIQDVCKPIKIKDKINFIIHAASRASPKYYGKDPVGVLSANIIGTMNLLEMAKEKKVESFLFFSSGEVYGEVSKKDIPTKENMYGYVDPALVRSCYAESKRMGETICVSYARQYGVPAKIARPFHTYGPGMALDDGRVYADFVSNIVNNQNIIMKSDGSATRAFCYIADATIGFFKVLLQGKNGEPYNVGNDKGKISILELANRLVKLFSEKALKVIRQENCQPKGYIKSKTSRACPDISKIRALGWTPKYSIEDGFTRTIRSFLV